MRTIAADSLWMSPRMSLQGVLEDEGMVVDLAHNCAEALVCAARHRPTMVVLAINLPDGPGREVASQLRAQPGAELWILDITADGSAARKAREVGAFAYLRKPFEMTHLLDLVFRRLAEPQDSGRNVARTGSLASLTGAALSTSE